MSVVTLSGGQDSTTCLAWALREHEAGRGDERAPVALSFDYGQRHKIELDLATNAARVFGVEHTILDLGPTFTQLGDASLTNPAIENADVAAPDSANTWAALRGLPPSFVPGRNLILLGLAAAFALPRGHRVVVTGVCEADEAGYPDCRGAFVDSLEDTISLAMDASGFRFHAPLLHRTKADTWRLASDLGCLEFIRTATNTCYEGDRSRLHSWGYGCGECPACQTRAAGWREFIAGVAS